MNIQIVSDVHAEFWSKKEKFGFIKPSAPILALLGDICCCGSADDFEVFKRFILELLPWYEVILFVSGNHEYYFNPEKKSTVPTKLNTLQGIDAKIKKFFNETSTKLHYLNNESLLITAKGKQYLIVGTTLWSWIPENRRPIMRNLMNDYQYIYVEEGKKIRRLVPDDVSNMYLKNVKYLKSQISRAKKSGHKMIVLSHHKPYTSTLYNEDTLDPAYESDLHTLMGEPVVLWGYGHTHVADSSMHGSTWMYSNPKGYPKQKTKYNKATSVKV